MKKLVINVSNNLCSEYFNKTYRNMTSQGSATSIFSQQLFKFYIQGTIYNMFVVKTILVRQL